MKRFFFGVLMLLPLVGAQAAPLAVGDTLQPFTIADQHGKSAQVDQTTRLLMFSRDMTANKLAQAAFATKPAQYLPDAHALYAIDVSGMPKFVTKTFAIPKMQKYVYRIFLDRDASVTTGLPAKKALVTLVHLDQLKVTGVDYASTADALTRAVEGTRP